ncbi:DUF4880 domain-containing protein [Paracidovorax anthurii]|uniref:FecR family protein n=1 Tax=Paracidovorax anthurii TaxID=78229 RepID=A0A328ZDN2_9BURK|nr:DUF4880 domain-containing protein [Paracidovorax anthurii]RAR80346.1 FecR family protein [Paracidovorax anthurii]
MHPGGGLTGADGGAPPSRAAVREAARWLARLHAGHASAQDHAAFERWRAAHPDHEQAWQRARRMQEQLGLVPPTLARAVLGRPDAPGRRRALRALGGLALALPVAHLAWREAGTAWAADLRTGVGERREAALPDGSRLWLDTDTAVALAFGPGERSVRLLRGEVRLLAGTTPGPQPLALHTAAGTLQALDAPPLPPAHFLARALDGADCRVTMQAGAVALRTGQGLDARVDAGQALAFGPGHLGAAGPADPFAGRWSEGLLVARGQPLGDFLAELARYRHGWVQCDPAVAGLPVTGAFQIDQGDAVLEALPRSLPVRVLWRTRYWARVLPAGSGA